MKEKNDKKFILWFKEIGIEDVPLVGGKNASLGEMYRKLAPKGINVPNGFAITAYAYRHFLESSKIENQIQEVLNDLDTNNISNLVTKGRQIRDIIRHTEIPADLNEAICLAYDELSA